MLGQGLLAAPYEPSAVERIPGGCGWHNQRNTAVPHPDVAHEGMTCAASSEPPGAVLSRRSVPQHRLRCRKLPWSMRKGKASEWNSMNLPSIQVIDQSASFCEVRLTLLRLHASHNCHRYSNSSIPAAVWRAASRYREACCCRSDWVPSSLGSRRRLGKGKGLAQRSRGFLLTLPAEVASRRLSHWWTSEVASKATSWIGGARSPQR